MANEAAQQDRAQVVFARWDAKVRQALKPLITPELIEEHRRKPLGQHSDTLERVLNYFRRAPIAGKYVVVCTEPYREYRIGVLPGRRGAPIRVLDAPRFGSEEEAEHGVFLQRVKDLLASE
jgi:branched-chain amino acid transport system permease protein